MTSTFTLSAAAQASILEVIKLASEPARAYTSVSIQAAISFSHGSNCWCNIFSRLMFLNPGAAAPPLQLLDYGNDIYVSEIVSVREALKNIKDISVGIWKCGNYVIKIVNEGYAEEINLIRPREYISAQHRHTPSNWRANYYEVYAMSPAVLPEPRYLSSAVSAYSAIEDLIFAKFQVDLRDRPNWRGVVQIFLPNYTAK